MPPRKKASIAPYGDTLPNYRNRLENAPSNADREVVAARLWEKWNIPDPARNFGFTAIEFILYGEQGALDKPIPISERDRQVVAATVQHILGTNDGWALLCQFEKDLKIATEVETVHDHSEIIHGRSWQTDRYLDGCLVHSD